MPRVAIQVSAADKVAIGRRVREARTGRGLTLVALGRLIGAPIGAGRCESAVCPYLANIERGASSMCLGTVLALCRELTISADWLLFGKEDSCR